MTIGQLTNRARTATSQLMASSNGGRRGLNKTRASAFAMVVAGSMTLGGCISVNAPDKPIVIELNINIKQEVVYRLAADAGNTIQDNPDIF